MRKKNVLFTFDYELFLGKRSGNVSNCVIDPTNRLLDIFSDFKLSKAIFFVDTIWLMRLKEIILNNVAAKKDFERVVQQLNEIKNKGHYIFPHLHPHWINASYLTDVNQWQLINYSRYRFHNLDKGERETYFKDSIGFLKEILGEEYRPIAYRAGGWSIQPFEDFEPLFRKYGIKYDLSVLPGNKCISTGQHYDFSDIDLKRPYSFSKDVTVPVNGDFTEFPISTIDVPPYKLLLNKLLLKYLLWTGDRTYGDGQSIVTETVEQSGKKGEMVSVELLNKVKLSLYLKFLEKNNYMHFIAHPKMLTDHNINTFVRFLEKTLKLYIVETDIRKMI
ncbi:MAG TPA: hypothetical protein VK783_01775 [Bacteroidia bacterium]|jgi:hypothetical protein|nr:hypothetical protein [Bacteroidia bacterium]